MRHMFAITLFLASGLALPALADPLPAERKHQTGSKIKLQRNACAAYGPGYVQVAGGTTCVKVGGKVRFEMMMRSSGNVFRSR